MGRGVDSWGLRRVGDRAPGEARSVRGKAVDTEGCSVTQVTWKCALEQRGGGRRGAGRLEEVVLHRVGGHLAARPRLLHLSRLPHESLHCRVGRRHPTKEGKSLGCETAEAFINQS